MLTQGLAHADTRRCGRFNYSRLGVSNFFHKGPDSKYFRLCGPRSICHNHSAPLSACESLRRYAMKEYSCGPTKLHS